MGEVAGSNPVVPTILPSGVSSPITSLKQSDYGRLFRVLDGYAKRHHDCFLAELDLHEEAAECVACFRPRHVGENSKNRYACRYVTLEIAEVREIIRVGLLPISAAAFLDEELHSLSQTAP